MVYCCGCGGEFSLGRGYLNHMQLSRNPDCAAIYQQSIAHQLDVDSDDSEDDFGGDEDDMDVEWPDQDLFVAVGQASGEEDMGGWKEEIDMDRDEANENAYDSNLPGSDSEEEFGDGNEIYWEPLPSTSNTSDMGGEQDLEAENGLEVSQEARLAAEDAFRKHPIIEKFPDTCAGAPITN